jgi:hypothetical protein
MTYALAHTVIAVRAGWSRCQEWLSCTRILWDWLHGARPHNTTQANDGVARSKRKPLQVHGLRSHLEQSSRVVGVSRFRMA